MVTGTVLSCVPLLGVILIVGLSTAVGGAAAAQSDAGPATLSAKDKAPIDNNVATLNIFILLSFLLLCTGNGGLDDDGASIPTNANPFRNHGHCWVLFPHFLPCECHLLSLLTLADGPVIN